MFCTVLNINKFICFLDRTSYVSIFKKTTWLTVMITSNKNIIQTIVSSNIWH